MPLNAFYDADGKLIDVGRGALLEGRLAETLENTFGITY
jgi:hypothetical protein